MGCGTQHRTFGECRNGLLHGVNEAERRVDVVFRDVRGAIGEVAFGDRTPRDGPGHLPFACFFVASSRTNARARSKSARPSGFASPLRRPSSKRVSRSSSR